jgi:hypothetical protein
MPVDATVDATVGVRSVGAPESLRAFGARTGAAYCALGAGLVVLALGSEHLAHHPTVAVGLVGLGAAEVVWAVLALRGPAPLARAALATLLAGAVAWLVVGTALTGALGLADAAAVGLQLLAGVLLAVTIRPSAPSRAGGPFARVGVLAMTSLVVAAITVPGLASTDAGEQAHMPGMAGMSGHGGHG